MISDLALLSSVFCCGIACAHALSFTVPLDPTLPSISTLNEVYDWDVEEFETRASIFHNVFMLHVILKARSQQTIAACSIGP